MADETQYDGLTVSVRKTASGDHYQAFVNVNGVDLPLAGVQAGDFEASLADAQTQRDAAELEAARARPAEPAPADGSQGT